MRLLDTETGEFVQKDPRKDVNLKYAILSHTWDAEGEQTYQVLRNIQQRYDLGKLPPLPDPRDESSAIPSPKQSSLVSVTTPVTHNSFLEEAQLLKLYVLKPIWGLLVFLLTCMLPPRFIELIRNTYRPDHHSVLSILASIYYQSDTHVPPHPYTIEPISSGFSHRSEGSEEGQPEMLPRSIWDDPELSPKVREACTVARANGYQYIWIDSCCIDKTSSSELSEAINSMYAWYARAEICYAYLADVPPAADHRKPRSDFRGSVWFTRGWTLQELIAPLDVLFLSGDWAPIEPKYALADLVQEITGISEEALLHVEPLDQFSVAQRLSWASGRETTRVEDQAYSLLGIFDINMPTLYGEGDRAFRRLQEEIMQRVPDQSLFAWGDIYLGPPIFKSPGPHTVTTTSTPEMSQRVSFYPQSPTSPLAMAPRFFTDCRILSASSHDVTGQIHLEYTSSPYGIRTQFQMLPLSILFHPDSLRRHRREEMEEESQWYLAILGCQHAERPGHLLGRVCYVPPSESGVDFVYPGYVHISPKSFLRGKIISADILLLSPETIERRRPHIRQRMVYIAHPDRHDPKASQANTSQPQHSINLVLLTKTRDALRAQGYTVDFRSPEKRRQTGTHRLTLSNDKHDITAEFQHALESDGQQLTITARVAILGRNLLDSAAGDSESPPPRADPNTVTWTDSIPWRARLGQHKGVKLSVGGASQPLILRLRLDLICAEAYHLHVVLLTSSDPPTAAVSSSPVRLVRGEEDGVHGIDAEDVPHDPGSVDRVVEHT